MSGNRKTDRRIERTRILLRDALMSLIEERGYHEITVQDITDRANVARTTFYLHFKDKDELLFSTMRDLYEDLYAHSPVFTLEQARITMSDPTDLLHVQQYANFYRIMLGERGSMAFLVRVRQYLTDVMHDRYLVPLVQQHRLKPRLPLSLIASIMAGIEIATIQWWVDHDMQPSAGDMARMIDRFSSHSVLWGLGITPDDPAPDAP